MSKENEKKGWLEKLSQRVKTYLAEQEEMAEMVLKDGTKVIVENDDVFLIATEDGEEKRIKAPEGNHETEDGKILVVDADGKLVEVKEKEEQSEEPKEEGNEQMQALQEKFEALEAENKSMKEEFSQVKSILEDIAKLKFSEEKPEGSNYEFQHNPEENENEHKGAFLNPQLGSTEAALQDYYAKL